MRKQSPYSARPSDKSKSGRPEGPRSGARPAGQRSARPPGASGASGTSRPGRSASSEPSKPNWGPLSAKTVSRGPARDSARSTTGSAKIQRDKSNQEVREPRGSGFRPQVDIPKNTRIVIGHHAILEAIATHPKACSQIWLQEGWESSQELKKILTELRPQGLQPVVKPETVLDRFGGSHQGAALFMSHRPEIDWASLAAATESKMLLLDGIEDPHNLGAILRTSWLMGVKGILIPEDRAVGLTATVHKVACGGAEHVPVQECTSFANPIEELKKQGYWVFGLSHEGKKTIFDLKIPEKVVWCIGAEDKGLRSTTERLCDELVRIPQVSAKASYNASVAASIALTETFRQQTLSREKSSSNL